MGGKRRESGLRALRRGAALGLALLTGCAPAESALSQVEPITQESEAPSLLRP